MSETTAVECTACGHTLQYTLSNDGRILDPCPKCDLDALTVVDDD